MARIREYFYGLILAFVLFITLAAIDVVHVEATFTLSKLIIPCFLAFFLWSCVYILCMAIASVALVILQIFNGFGLIIAPLLLGVVAVNLAEYIDDMHWYTIQSGWFSSLGMGLVLSTVMLITRSKRLQISFGSDNK